MNILTIILWITIAIIGAIAIILVKLHYQGDKLENEDGSILPTAESINEALNMGKNKFNEITDNSSPQETYPNLAPENSQKNNYQSLFRKNVDVKEKNDDYIARDVEVKEIPNYEYASQNQILINYDNNVKKFQEPIKQSQMDIMNKNKNNNSELKDLFTIDELIKESKRKDDKREKESQTIKKDTDENDLNEIKDSIKNKTPEPLIEEVISEEEKTTELPKNNIPYLDGEEQLADELLKEGSAHLDEKTLTELQESKKETEAPFKESEIPPADKPETAKVVENTQPLTQKEENTSPLTQEVKENTQPSTQKEENTQPSTQKEEEISEPILKTPHKIEKDKDTSSDEEYMDLDYRKDIDKVKNKITSTKIFQEVKEKLSPEPDESSIKYSEPYTKEVAQYNDEYAPIINETHVDVDATYEQYHDEKLRQENSRRVFNAEYNPQKSVGEIKSKPARDNIKITINNSEVVLKKGDEIIFNYDGETYSSKVFAINGDDITVKYRGKKAKIKGEDVKKIY